MKSLICFLLLILAASCSQSDDPIIGYYHPSNTGYPRNAQPDYADNRTTGKNVKQETFLDFFKNGSYVMYITSLETGHYSMSADTVFLTPDEGDPWEIKYTESAGLGHFKFPEAENLTSLRKVLHDGKDHYPFTAELNRWRVRPNRSMSNNELIEKFQNYARFKIAYMRWAQRNEQKLTMKTMSGPLQYANNGLMMRRMKDTIAWCDFFYPGDCERMDEILRNYFDGLVIDWRYTHDRVSMLTDALGQVIKGIDNHRENFK